MSSPPPPGSNLCKTGVQGLDDVLYGGLPRNRLYLVQGEPGVGKTTLAMQFLLAGAKAGERGLYITLSETKAELEEVARSHGWDLSALDIFELSAVESHLRAEAETTFFSPSEIELNRTTKTLLAEVDRVQPTRVVVDSLSELRLMSETALRYRRQILHLKQFFAGRMSTVLMLDDGSARDEVDDQVESLAHGVMTLTKSAPEFGISRRQLHVKKIRGVKFREGNHDVLITTGELFVLPRLVAAEHHQEFRREDVSAGIAGLDELLGGGLGRGTSSIFLGPAGTGKSTLAMTFAAAAAGRGEPVLFFTFDETRDTLLVRARELALPIREHLESGRLRVQQIDPAELSPGELTHIVQRGVQRDGVRMVVIDSLNGFMHAMPDQRNLILQLHELVAFLNQQGVVTVMILTQQGLMGTMSTPLDLTYLADTVLLLRFFEYDGSVRQAASVMKKRSGRHERTIREFTITREGIKVGNPLKGFRGVLTGAPMLLGEPPLG